MKVTSPSVIKRLLAENGLNPLKKFGQNFLIDQNIADKTADAAAPPDSNVLEVGIGLGALTDSLCQSAKRVVTIEIDKGLANLAAETQREHSNLHIIENDFLKTDLETISKNYFSGEPFYACGNLPYYITAPIIMKILESDSPVISFTAMVQKEVAQRLAARPKDSEYGIITAAVDYFGGAKMLFSVSKNCFYPAPKIDSAVIKINIERKHKIPFNDYRDVVKAAFAMRRKTISNNLKKLYGGKTAEILASCGISKAARPQDISSDDYLRIAAVSQNIN